MNRNVLIAGLIALVLLGFVFLKFGPGTSGQGSSGVGSSSQGFSSQGSTDPATPSASVDGFTEGVHYRKVAQNAAKSEKILVQEFFWYGCPHCQKFEPAIREYKKTLADDIQLVQIPVTWNEGTSLHAAMHYVAMESEDTEKLQDDLFEKIISIRKEGNLKKQIEDVKSVFANHGINTDDFESQLNSPEIQGKVAEAEKLMRMSGITGTPAIMVDNTWVVLNNEEVSKAGVFNVVDHLVGQAKADRSK